MSITYGHFSSPLNVTVSSGQFAGSSIYFTIPWSNAGYIDRIRIYSPTGSSTNFGSIYILSNGAHERLGDASALDEYLYTDAVGKNVSSANNYSAFWNIDPAFYYEDEYARGYLYIKLEFSGGTPANQKFVLTVQGRKSYHSVNINNNTNGVPTLRDYRVLMAKSQSGNGGTGGQVTDVTTFARSAAFGSTAGISIGATNDYIYVGSIKRLDHWDFGVGLATTNGKALQGAIWDGSTWAAFQILDNSACIGGSSLRYSGIVEGAGLASSTWAPTRMDPVTNILFPNDPLSAYENDIIAGNTKPIGMFYNPQRYWARFNVPLGMSDTVLLKYVLPIVENYGVG